MEWVKFLYAQTIKNGSPGQIRTAVAGFLQALWKRKGLPKASMIDHYTTGLLVSLEPPTLFARYEVPSKNTRNFA